MDEQSTSKQTAGDARPDPSTFIPMLFISEFGGFRLASKQFHLLIRPHACVTTEKRESNIRLLARLCSICQLLTVEDSAIIPSPIKLAIWRSKMKLLLSFF